MEHTSVMRNSLTASEQIANLSRCELVIDSVTFLLMLALALVSETICSGENGLVVTLLLGFPLLCLMTWESAMTAFIARLVYSLDFQFMDMPNSQRQSMKAFSVLATLLSAAKWLALVIPSGRGSAIQDFCDEGGLWCEPRWLFGEIIPSIGIFILTFALMHLNERIADRNKTEKYTI
jgi:hypothetical protein